MKKNPRKRLWSRIQKSNMVKEVRRRFTLKNEKGTESLGLEIAKCLKGGGTLALIGDLGAGKTTLTKYIAKGLGISKMITSPTFTIVNEYHEVVDGEQIDFYHVDAYRLEDEEAAFYIGLEEYFGDGNICVIEWADIVEGILPEDTKYVYLEQGEDEEERIANCTF